MSAPPRLRLLLPQDARTELARRALEERRSIEHQAEHMLEELLRRSQQRRIKSTSERVA
jgi:hypothetical protein